MRLPIRLRVTAAFALAMAVVLAGTGWFLYARLESHLAETLDRDLRLRAQDLSALVAEPRGTLATASGGRLIEHGESYAQLLDAGNRVLDATVPLRGRSLLNGAELRTALERPLFAERPLVPGLDEPSRLLATPLDRDGERLVLLVGVTKGDNAETLAGLRDVMLVAGPVALVLASLAGYALAALSLRAVDSMRRCAEEISAERPGERLPVPLARDELQRLAETLNRMLDRLEEALQRERDFVADAGHELRTPLALLRTELELALRHDASPEELREAIARSVEEVDRLTQLSEDLLLLARTEGGRLSLQLEPVSVGELLDDVAARFAWRADESGRSLAIEDGRDLAVQGDRLRLEQALGNLVDNALRHGEGDVTLAARARNGAVELHVVDAGGGIPAGFLGEAFERFTRADQARGRGGAGLGLAIVQAIAAAHGGRAGAEGADVWIALPAQRSTST